MQYKYIYLVCIINVLYSIVDSRRSTCQSATKNWKKSFDLGCITDYTGNIWDCLAHNKPKKTLYQKFKSSTECFTWAVFKEDSDDLISFSFRSIISDIVYIIIDFTHFYLEYISTIVSTVWNWRIRKFLVNPATIFVLAMFSFHRKIFMPLLRNIRRQLQQDDDNPECCTTCDLIKDNSLHAEEEFEDY